MRNSNDRQCPKCDALIPADAPGGLCPMCAMEGAAFASSATTVARNAAPPTVEELAPHFPELEILELIGAGGMGAVYKARQPQLDRLVALKVLSLDLSADPTFEERFNREARVLARLSHANIVAIFDYGTAGPYCYLLMELVDGVNLRQAMQAGRFTPAESLTMVENICAALKFAHEEGILHRDIKPENVLIDSKGRVKIADFGIAKLVGEDEQPDVTLTMQGSVLGSPHYMAPEQIETPGDVDQRADIYSLGVVFYELLTGELPIGRFALPSEKAAMDARIDEIVLRTLEKEREARFQSAEEVMTEVGAVAQGPPTAPATTPSPASGDDAGGVRGSLSSAIFTGISLVTLVATAILTSSELFSAKVTGVIGAIGFCLSACLAIVGIILGCVALGGIRRSGGQKSGLGLAVFGTVAWPILMMPSVSLNYVVSGPAMAAPSGGSGFSISPWVSMVFLVLPAFIAAFVLVRTLRRWAGGVPREDGSRDFPGMGRGLALVALLALMGPALQIILPRFLPPSARPDRLQPQTKHFPLRTISEDAAILEHHRLDEVRWRMGEPALTLPMTLNSGHKATLRMFMQQSNGDTEHIASLGTWEVAPGRSREQASISIGTELIGTTHRLVIVQSGKFSGVIRSLEDLRDYQFSDSLPETITFDSAGRHEFQLATPSSNDQGVLTLEVLVNE